MNTPLVIQSITKYKWLRKWVIELQLVNTLYSLTDVLNLSIELSVISTATLLRKLKSEKCSSNIKKLLRNLKELHSKDIEKILDFPYCNIRKKL